MKHFQEKNSFRKVLESKPVLILLFLILVFFLWNMLLFWEKRNETQKKLDIAEKKVLELRESATKLESDIESLSTDKGVEASIRDKYGLVKEGEQLIVVVDDPNFVPTIEEKQSFITKIKNWFR